MDKSSWVPSRTKDVVPIVVADGQMYYGYWLWVLRQLYVPGDRRQLGPMTIVTLSILSHAFVDYDYLLALYLN
jgi:hypothetical protein